MENLIIKANEGIGMFKLGMTKDEINNCFDVMNKQYYENYNFKRKINDFFKIEYDNNNKVVFIEVCKWIKEDFNCIFNNIDVFNTKVDSLIAYIEKQSSYDKDDPELGYSYYFPSLGLAFWRPIILTEEDLMSNEFKELSIERQKEELQYLYFETVSISIKGYYN